MTNCRVLQMGRRSGKTAFRETDSGNPRSQTIFEYNVFLLFFAHYQPTLIFSLTFVLSQTWNKVFQFQVYDSQNNFGDIHIPHSWQK